YSLLINDAEDSSGVIRGGIEGLAIRIGIRYMF
ncbi:MAG: hypothetical protein ACI8QS_002872, partial [Planctomycetota bacterium]